jgi:CO/xanthine dehydrogenase Mo-binding subunit
MLHAALLPSPHASARILRIDAEKACVCPGVRAVVTGEDLPILFGLYLGDKPPLARGSVRHFGEPVAAVVADSEREARFALSKLSVEYEPSAPVLTPREALSPGAPVIHPEMDSYTHIPDILPEPGSNVANRTKIRKGDTENAFASAPVTVEVSVSFPPGDHVALEPRCALAEIRADGRHIIHSSTQAPFVARNLLGIFLGIPQGKITVIAPPCGGGFGGKAGIQLEGLAVLLSRAVGGRPVRLANTRELDLTASPGHIGLEATVKLAADEEGRLLGMDLLYLFNSGAFADYAVNVSRAAAIACTGPYRVENVKCDSLCVYTNTPFATAYRGFGHIELCFAVERAMDALAAKAGIDPVELRLKNAIRPGDTTPTGSLLDSSTGDLPECVRRAAGMIGWNEGSSGTLPSGKVFGKGIGLFWKAPAMPPNTDAGAILTFNEDGSMNLSVGVTEIGQAAHTALAQLVAAKFGVSPGLVHVQTTVDTSHSPHDWATAASRSVFMAGNAALEAAEDALAAIRRTASIPLRCSPGDLNVAGGRVFLKGEPERGFPLSQVVLGYTYPGGNSIEGQVIGTGRYIAPGLSAIDPETGEGHPALEWTLGAEAVHVEGDPADGSYRVVKAVCAMDVGRVINPDLARGQAVGAMEMALGFSCSEGFRFTGKGRIVNVPLRHFKIPRYGDDPEYGVSFVETPQHDGPCGMRGMGEQGVLGIPGATAGALSRAFGCELRDLPLTPESIWRACGKERDE